MTTLTDRFIQALVAGVKRIYAGIAALELPKWFGDPVIYPSDQTCYGRPMAKAFVYSPAVYSPVRRTLAPPCQT